jgi:hypothetical protein
MSLRWDRLVFVDETTYSSYLWVVQKEYSETHYTFKVNLIGQRRASTTFFLRGDRTLSNLHQTISYAFNRHDDSEVYSFYFPSATTAYKFDPYPKEYVSEVVLERSEPLSDREPSNAGTTTLDSLNLLVGQTFEYLSDFGDSSLHEIKVVAKRSYQVGKKSQAVEQGQSAFPPTVV